MTTARQQSPSGAAPLHVRVQAAISARFDRWHEILDVLARRKLRTALTALSVAWGIFMLVLLLAAGQGLTNGAQNESQRNAQNSLYLFPGRLSKPHQGNPIGKVMQIDKPAIYPHVDDDATVILRYPAAQAVLMPSWNWTFGRKDMEVYGTKAYAIAVNPTVVRQRFAESAPEETVTEPALAAPEDTSLHYLAAVVRGEIQPHGDLSALDTNVTVMRILDAARESTRTGRTVNLKTQ